jgi:hypothetical protein
MRAKDAQRGDGGESLEPVCMSRASRLTNTLFLLTSSADDPFIPSTQHISLEPWIEEACCTCPLPFPNDCDNQAEDSKGLLTRGSDTSRDRRQGEGVLGRPPGKGCHVGRHRV